MRSGGRGSAGEGTKALRGDDEVAVANVGTYALYESVNCVVASASSTVSISFSWTDTSSTVQTTAAATATCTTLGSASYATVFQIARVKAGTSVTRIVTISGTPTFDVSAVAVPLTSN